MTQLQLLEQSKGDTAEDRTCQADLRMKAVPETNTIAGNWMCGWLRPLI